MVELERIQKVLEGKWVPLQRTDTGKPMMPAYFDGWMPAAKDTPDVVIRQMDNEHATLVVEVKAASIIKGDAFPLGYSLRFPRIVAFRTDKPLSQSLLRGPFLELATRPSLAIAPKDGEYRDFTSSRRGPTRGRSRGGVTNAAVSKRGVVISSAFVSTDTSGIAVEEPILHGVGVYILPAAWEFETSLSPDLRSRGALEALVKRIGGTVVPAATVLSPSDALRFIIANDVTSQTRNFAKLGFDVLRPTWLVDALNTRSLPAPEPAYVLHAGSVETRRAMRLIVDNFGDRNNVQLTTRAEVTALVERVREAMHSRDVARPAKLDYDTMRLLDSSPFALFRRRAPHRDPVAGHAAMTAPAPLLAVARDARPCGVIAYIDRWATIATSATASAIASANIQTQRDPQTSLPLDMCALQLELYGGTATSVIDERVNLIVTACEGPAAHARLDELRRAARSVEDATEGACPIVRHTWVHACVTAKTQLPVNGYEL